MTHLYSFLHGVLVILLLLDPAQCAALGEQLCVSKKVDVNDGLIIDVKASVTYGAKVLGGASVESTEACTSNCCGIEGCDLALYKKEGKSGSGKNCYYLQCGVLANCKMVRHEGFVSVVMADNGQQATQDIGKEGIQDEPAPATTQPPSHQEPSAPLVTISPVPQPTSPTSVSPLPTTTKLLPSTGLQTNPPSATAAEEVGNQGHVMDNTAITLDDCERDGCAGVGAIVAATVGAIGLLLVAVVTLVIVKRTYNLHKRRKFTNVDYLINGMYA